MENGLIVGIIEEEEESGDEFFSKMVKFTLDRVYRISRVKWPVLIMCSFDKGQRWRRIRLVCEKRREEVSWQGL